VYLAFCSRVSDVSVRGMRCCSSCSLSDPLRPRSTLFPYTTLFRSIQPVTLNEDAGYDETDQQQVTMDGQIYGAPTVIEALVMFYNTELLDAAPETFEELEAISQDERFAFEGEEGRNVGFLTNWVDFYMTYGLLAGYGGYVFGEDGTNTEDIGLNSEGAIEAIEYATNWYQNTWPQGMLDI